MIMTLEQREHIAELSLIAALPKFILDLDRKAVKGTRMENILKRIEKHCQKAIKATPPMHKHDTAYCFDRLLEFFDALQWTENIQIDVRTMMSFLLGLIEESKAHYPQTIVDALNDGFERLSEENEEDAKYIREAERALKVWKQGFKKYKEAA